MKLWSGVLSNNAAKVRIWEDEGDSNQKHVAVLINDVFLGTPSAPSTEAAESAITALLGNRDPLCGELRGEYSVADISVFMTLAFASTMGATTQSGDLAAWF